MAKDSVNGSYLWFPKAKRTSFLVLFYETEFSKPRGCNRVRRDSTAFGALPSDLGVSVKLDQSRPSLDSESGRAVSPCWSLSALVQ